MFRQLVSNLPFSPALIGQVGFYAKRLRSEQATRKLGFVFMALALVVQSLAVFSPPQSANAASPSDLLRGGIRTKNELLSAYDANTSNYKEIANYAGITRSELENTTETTFNSHDKDKTLVSWGRVSRFSEADGEVTHSIQLSDGSITQMYSTPLWKLDTLEQTIRNGSTYQAFVGYSEKNGWFAVMKNCANLAFEKEPSKPSSPEPEKKSIIVKNKTAYNLTQGVQADTTPARAGDRIEYTLTIRNDGDKESTEIIEDHLTDVVEYSTLIDAGGGEYDGDQKILSWKTLIIPAQTTEIRKFVVELFKEIPITARGQSDPNSYDCQMINGFGNTIKIAVDCPQPKIVEQTIAELPKTGPSDALLIVGGITAVATYFYARSKQLNKELKLVRKGFNHGLLQT